MQRREAARHRLLVVLAPNGLETAEELVLEYNGHAALLTGSMRPAWGEPVGQLKASNRAGSGVRLLDGNEVVAMEKIMEVPALRMLFIQVENKEALGIPSGSDITARVRCRRQ